MIMIFQLSDWFSKPMIWAIIVKFDQIRKNWWRISCAEILVAGARKGKGHWKIGARGASKRGSSLSPSPRAFRARPIFPSSFPFLAAATQAKFPVAYSDKKEYSAKLVHHANLVHKSWKQSQPQKKKMVVIWKMIVLNWTRCLIAKEGEAKAYLHFTKLILLP